MVRQPAVAGKFYSKDPYQLREELGLMVPAGETCRAIGIVAPHAGYVYSGRVAGSLYGAIAVPDAVLVIGPNHTGTGSGAALAPSGAWLTPLGEVPVNSRLSKLILKHAPSVREDVAAHRFEHSLEVQLPFLKYRNPSVTIAALCLSGGDFDTLSALGEGIARAISEYGDEVLVVASSDMSHYLPDREARRKDELALAHLVGLDPEALLRVCREQGITMCGVAPATLMLVAAKALGATSSRLMSYATSGEVNGDLNRVVGYAALLVS